MGYLMDVLLTRPLGIILMSLYEIIGSYGLAIIIFTVVFKLILMPLSLKTKRSTAKSSALQPKLMELRKKYKNDQQKLNMEMQKLYQEAGVNPMGGCLPMLIQFPIMIALYYAVQRPLTFMMGLGEEQIQKITEVAAGLGVEIAENAATSEIILANAITENFDKFSGISDLIIPIDFNFLGINLAATPDVSQLSILWLIPIMSGAFAFISSYVTQKMQAKSMSMENNPAASTMKTMMFTMPIMSVAFGFAFPAAVGLYWALGSIMIIVQELLLGWYIKKTGNSDTTSDNSKSEKKGKKA